MLNTNILFTKLEFAYVNTDNRIGRFSPANFKCSVVNLSFPGAFPWERSDIISQISCIHILGDLKRDNPCIAKSQHCYVKRALYTTEILWKHEAVWSVGLLLSIKLSICWTAFVQWCLSQYPDHRGTVLPYPPSDIACCADGYGPVQ